MSEMVERIKAALERKRHELKHSPGDDEPDVLCYGEEYARAAITAMREPTEEMIDAGVDDYPGEGLLAHGPVFARCIWEAMIDAALAEEKQPA